MCTIYGYTAFIKFLLCVRCCASCKKWNKQSKKIGPSFLSRNLCSCMERQLQVLVRPGSQCGNGAVEAKKASIALAFAIPIRPSFTRIRALNSVSF